MGRRYHRRPVRRNDQRERQPLAESRADGSTTKRQQRPDETWLDMDVLSNMDRTGETAGGRVAHPLLPESELARLKTNLLRRPVAITARTIALARFGS